MGTLTKKLENDFSIVGKGGIASYEAEIEKLELDGLDLGSLTDDASDKGFSLRAFYQRNEKQDVEFSVTKMFGDAEYLSFNFYWKCEF